MCANHLILQPKYGCSTKGKHPRELKWAKSMAAAAVLPHLRACGSISCPCTQGSHRAGLAPRYGQSPSLWWVPAWEFQLFISPAGFTLELLEALSVACWLRTALGLPITWLLQLHPQQAEPLGCPGWLPTLRCTLRAVGQGGSAPSWVQLSLNSLVWSPS